MNRITIALAAMLAVLLCAQVSVFAAAPSSKAGQCIDYTVGSTQYHAASVAQTPTVMSFTNWAIGPCSVTPPPNPPGLYASGKLMYGNKGGFITNADLTKWETLWGRQGVEQQPVVFPGVSGATPVWTPGRGQYTCSKFHTPATGNLTGQYKNSSYYSQSAVDISLSAACGTFTPGSCTALNARNDDRPVLPWDLAGAGSFRCHLPRNLDIYLNIRRTDPNSVGKISVIGQQG